MKKITQVIEAKSGGVFVIFDDGGAERMTRAEFKARAEEFKDVDGVASMLHAWAGEDDTAREARENRERCRRVAEELEAAVRGGKECPHCGAIVDADDVEEVEREDEDGDVVPFYHCPACGEETPDEFEDYTIYDYLTDIYDTEYNIDGRGDYRSVRYMVAAGGPNYVDRHGRGRRHAGVVGRPCELSDLPRRGGRGGRVRRGGVRNTARRRREVVKMKKVIITFSTDPADGRLWAVYDDGVFIDCSAFTVEKTVNEIINTLSNVHAWNGCEIITQHADTPRDAMAEALARRAPDCDRLARLVKDAYITIDEAHRVEALALLNAARVNMSRLFEFARKSRAQKVEYFDAVQRYTGIVDALRIFAPDIVQAAEENFFND